ncbi:MAG: hypothetical protein Q4G68_14800 [Planctomycetia bacterium]|nr:hypothetical protein [Planctomycetia bacterium]
MLEKISGLTHMPFLCKDETGKKILFYSTAKETENPLWKLHYIIGENEPYRLETGFTENAIECSPTAWQDETGWHVSFISSGNDSGVYRLYRMDGTTLDALSKPVAVRIARSGFIHEERIVVGEVQDVVHIHDTQGDRKIILPGAFLYRVAYRADFPNKLLISGDWIGETADVFTLEYDLETDTQRYLECDGSPAYKCTVLGDEILYAKRDNGGFENRHLCHSNHAHGIDCKIAEKSEDILSSSGLHITKNCGCRLSRSERAEKPVRTSCLECVEKHLGAAAVLLSEVHNGYSYRFFLIGHLHEAEEESQAWPNLHTAIQEARRNYTHTGTVPDWESLAQLVREIQINETSPLQ